MTAFDETLLRFDLMDYATNVNRFYEEIRDRLGGDPGPVHADGRLHRFDTDKSGDKCGWYVAHADGDFIAGAFGSWKSGEKHTWNSGNGTRTAVDQAKIKAMFDNLEKKRVEVKKTAQKRAKRVWETAKPAEEHPYLDKKGIRAHGARLYKRTLLVPVIDKGGEVVSLQFIAGDGSKRFLKGGTVAGGSFTIPGEGDPILCEGFATGASIAEATGRPVVIAFNAGNLLKVAESGMTVAGDNDAWTTDKNNEPWNPNNGSSNG
jgi:putative DNA primase/helicase